MDEGAYPLTLYRSGSAFDWDGRPTDSRVVIDEDEHLQAADEGWMEAAEYCAPPKSADAAQKRGRQPKEQDA